MAAGKQTHINGNVWQVEGEATRVIDGDTFEARVDLGWRIQYQITVRLADIDAPELPSVLGQSAKLFLEQLLPAGTRIIVTSHELDKYGRTVGKVMLRLTGADVSARLVAAGLAVFRTF